MVKFAYGERIGRGLIRRNSANWHVSAVDDDACINITVATGKKSCQVHSESKTAGNVE